MPRLGAVARDLSQSQGFRLHRQPVARSESRDRARVGGCTGCRESSRYPARTTAASGHRPGPSARPSRRVSRQDHRGRIAGRSRVGGFDVEWFGSICRRDITTCSNFGHRGDQLMWIVRLHRIGCVAACDQRRSFSGLLRIYHVARRCHGDGFVWIQVMQRVQCRDTDGWNAETQGKAAGRSDGNADAGEIAGADADADAGQVGPSLALAS